MSLIGETVALERFSDGRFFKGVVLEKYLFNGNDYYLLKIHNEDEKKVKHIQCADIKTIEVYR